MTYKKIISVLFLGLSLATLPTLVFAQDAPPADTTTKPQEIPCPGNLPCITKETQLAGGAAVRNFVTGTFGTVFFQGFLATIALTSVVFIIVGGLQMHFAFGNEEGITKAKKTLIWAIAALVIAILSVTLVRVVSNIGLK